MKKFSVLIALLLALSLLVITGCGPTVTTATTPTTPTTSNDATTATTASSYVRKTASDMLTVGVLTKTGGFDPVEQPAWINLNMVYETPFFLNPETQKPEGMLVESYKFIDDTHLSLKLYDNATFSNGDPVTAADCLWSWKRMVDKADKSMIASIDWDNCTIVNDKEFVLALKNAFGPIINYLTYPAFAVVSKKAMENATADDWWGKPVGSGPFTVVTNISGSGSTYKLNESYWNKDKMPAFSQVTVKNYGDAAAMMIDYEAGNLDAALSVSTSDAQRVADGLVADTKSATMPEHNVYSVAFPEYTKVFDDIRVRQALCYALDMNALTTANLGILGKATGSVVASGINYAKSYPIQEYNPEKAASLLNEAGIEPGSLNLRVVIVSNPRDQRMSEMIQAYWAAVGVTLTIEAYDLPTAIQHFMKNDTDVVMYTTSGNTVLDPHMTLMMNMKDSSNGTIRMMEDEFNTPMSLGMTSIDAAVREGAYATAQDWLNANYRMIPIAETFQMNVWRPYVNDFITNGVKGVYVRFITFND